MTEQIKYEHNDPRRPKPDLELRYKGLDVVDGKVENGDLYALMDFVEMAKNGSVTNWDGTGYYAYANEKRVLESNQRAKPDEIRKGAVDWYWTHVIWYNK